MGPDIKMNQIRQSINFPRLIQFSNLEDIILGVIEGAGSKEWLIQSPQTVISKWFQSINI